MFKIIFIVPRRTFRPSSATIRCRSDPECKVIPHESRRQSQLVMKNPLQIAISCQSRWIKNAPAGILSLAGAFRIRNCQIKTCPFLIKGYAAPFGIEPVCSRSGLRARRT